MNSSRLHVKHRVRQAVESVLWGVFAAAMAFALVTLIGLALYGSKQQPPPITVIGK